MLSLKEYREIAGNEEFFLFYEKMVDNRKYTVGNYVSIAARFPPINEAGISADERFRRQRLRDLRGIIFDEDGRVISLPLHKFMNLGEGEDHQLDNLNWNNGFVAYDKLDGSMIRPVDFYGKTYWCSKAGITHMTPDVHNFVERNQQYAAFGEKMLQQRITPIFEYMSPKHRIVIDYGPKDSMALLALRHMDTGEYIDNQIAAEFDIPVAKQWDVSSHLDLIETVNEMKGAEGVIIRFNNGPWVKVKSMDYVLLHKTRDNCTRERYIIDNILGETIDDLLPILPAHVSDKVMNYAVKFLSYYNEVVDEFTDRIFAKFNEVKDSDNVKKSFALVDGLSNRERSHGFSNWQEINSGDKDAFKKNTKAFFRYACNSSEANFKEKVAAIFPERPTWDIFEPEE